MGRVIKASRTGPSLIRAGMFAAFQDARAVLAQAEHEAQQLRAHAYQEGLAQGRAAAAAELFALARTRSAMIENTERDTARAALLVAAELLGQSLQREPEQILQVLGPHLARVRRAQHITVHVHPDDAQWLAQHLPAFRAWCETQELTGSVSVHADAGIQRGGCVVESSLGEIDARVETRLQLMAAALGFSWPKACDSSVREPSEPTEDPA